ncbi:LLM class flavin-dependent oxidoreductase [Kribbia dieselivorans]|uniref:LLM class flavin-dependent oxidoreductase n=1 Tax=Kribbia dieselivorans TaxID=331526 RepID=UPI000838665C|nr:LLM class flavin-dependent oxidoreductase [Kribbia dieselivorans]
MGDHLVLNAFLMGGGQHEAAWRLPEAPPADTTDITRFQRLAQIAERGKLDSIFFADVPAVGGSPARRPFETYDPIVLLSAIAAVTDHIGLIGTASTTFGAPFTLAHAFATLDHVSGGRAGWNSVTTASDDAARNYGLTELPSHATRYEMSAEFLDVVLGLWRGAGTPQGHPVVVQAGSSPAGISLAARYAEAVFTAQRTLAEGKEFYATLKEATVAAGRNPDHIKVLPGIVPFIGSTEQEATALQDRLDDLIVNDLALAQLAETAGVAPDEIDLDGPLPATVVAVTTVESNKSRWELTLDLARRDNLTVRQLLRRLGGGRGHRTLAGTPEQIADDLEVWFRAGAADGFNIMAPYFPDALETFVDEVVPVLRSRGLFRTEYTATTLRGHYGLPIPPSAREPRPDAAATV